MKMFKSKVREVWSVSKTKQAETFVTDVVVKGEVKRLAITAKELRKLITRGDKY